jgi:hypothetical protein
MDFCLTAFSTFLGAVVALTADRLTRQHDAKLREEAAINSLILDLAAKRAFLVTEDWDWAEGEVQRVVGSIIHARTLVRDARLSLRPRSPALLHLRNMTRACNMFIELSEREDDQHLKSDLSRLTAEMAREVESLHSLRPDRILRDPPGSFALPASL